MVEITEDSVPAQISTPVPEQVPVSPKDPAPEQAISSSSKVPQHPYSARIIQIFECFTEDKGDSKPTIIGYTNTPEEAKQLIEDIDGRFQKVSVVEFKIDENKLVLFKLGEQLKLYQKYEQMTLLDLLQLPPAQKKYVAKLFLV